MFELFYTIIHKCVDTQSSSMTNCKMSIAMRMKVQSEGVSEHRTAGVRVYICIYIYMLCILVTFKSRHVRDQKFPSAAWSSSASLSL